MQEWAWKLNKPALNGVEPVEGGPLTVSYGQNIDCRFDDVVLGPLVTAVSCSGADAAGGGSVGTPATAECFALSNSMESTQYLVVGRGTKLGIISLATAANVADGSAEGAGAPYGENVTDLFFTINAAGTEEISIGFDNTVFRVITAIAGASYTGAANSESIKSRIFGDGGSDAASSTIVMLGRGTGTPQNKVMINTLSGTTTMGTSAKQDIATIGGEQFTFTGFARTGRFWLAGTSNGLYFIDGDGKRFRPLMDEQPNDTSNASGYGMQLISYLGPGTLAPHVRSLRLYQGLDSRSVGVERYVNNNSPVMGRYGHAGASEMWIYLPIYNTITTKTYICAVRPRMDGDGHSQELSYFPIIELATESKFCVFTEKKGGTTRPRVWMGSGSNMAYFDEGNLARFPQDTGYVYATSGTLYGTTLVRNPNKLKRIDYLELETVGCSATNSIAIDLKYTDHMGAVQTVRCGAPIVSNGRKRIEVAPGGLAVYDVQPVFTFTGAGSTASPKIRYGDFRMYGDYVDAS